LIDPLFFTLFATGLTVGFGHCIGMCGPIAASFSFNLKEKNKTLPHLFYNSGRLTTYMLLGGVIGAAGSVTKTVSQMAGLQNMVMIAAGMMIIVMGLGMTGYLSRLNIFREGFYPKGMISKGFGKLRAIQSPFIYYPTGLLLGFLPCGSIYTALLIAARAGMETNSPWEGFFMGVGLMFFFGLGTVPALFLVAKLADLSWLKSREIIYKIGSIFMVLTGIYFVIRGIRF
jgi:hypothetical protein